MFKIITSKAYKLLATICTTSSIGYFIKPPETPTLQPTKFKEQWGNLKANTDKTVKNKGEKNNEIKCKGLTEQIQDK